MKVRGVRPRPTAIPVAPASRRAIPIAPPRDPFDFDDEEPLPLAEHYDEFDYEERPHRRRRKRKPKKPSKLVPLFIGYGAMLGLLILSVVGGVVFLLARGGEPTEEDTNWISAFAEVGLTALVLIVTYFMGRIKYRPSDSFLQVAAWSTAFPMLAVLLIVNIGFTTALRELFQVKHEPGPGLTLVTVLLLCLQPAIVEEWFFRHLALGSLRESVGVHWAVFISGAMFGVAHLLNPIGIPYLIVVGICLGYMRVWSGSLFLPMLLHGLHNALVLVANKVM